MKLVTTEKIYVGRTDLGAVMNNNPDKEFGYCNPLKRKDGTPLFIPKNTEVVKIGTNEEFGSLEEFNESLEEGMYDFIINDVQLRKEFDEAVEYANTPFIYEDSVSEAIIADGDVLK